jgi:hypothetical protein
MLALLLCMLCSLFGVLVQTIRIEITNGLHIAMENVASFGNLWHARSIGIQIHINLTVSVTVCNFVAHGDNIDRSKPRGKSNLLRMWDRMLLWLILSRCTAQCYRGILYLNEMEVAIGSIAWYDQSLHIYGVEVCNQHDRIRVHSVNWSNGVSLDVSLVEGTVSDLGLRLLIDDILAENGQDTHGKVRSPPDSSSSDLNLAIQQLAAFTPGVVVRAMDITVYQHVQISESLQTYYVRRRELMRLLWGEVKFDCQDRELQVQSLCATASWGGNRTIASIQTISAVAGREFVSLSLVNVICRCSDTLVDRMSLFYRVFHGASMNRSRNSSQSMNDNVNQPRFRLRISSLALWFSIPTLSLTEYLHLSQLECQINGQHGLESLRMVHLTLSGVMEEGIDVFGDDHLYFHCGSSVVLQVGSDSFHHWATIYQRLDAATRHTSMIESISRSSASFSELVPWNGPWVSAWSSPRSRQRSRISSHLHSPMPSTQVSLHFESVSFMVNDGAVAKVTSTILSLTLSPDGWMRLQCQLPRFDLHNATGKPCCAAYGFELQYALQTPPDSGRVQRPHLHLSVGTLQVESDLSGWPRLPAKDPDALSLLSTAQLRWHYLSLRLMEAHANFELPGRYPSYVAGQESRLDADLVYHWLTLSQLKLHIQSVPASLCGSIGEILISAQSTPLVEISSVHWEESQATTKEACCLQPLRLHLAVDTVLGKSLPVMARGITAKLEIPIGHFETLVQPVMVSLDSVCVDMPAGFALDRGTDSSADFSGANTQLRPIFKKWPCQLQLTRLELTMPDTLLLVNGVTAECTAEGMDIGWNNASHQNAKREIFLSMSDTLLQIVPSDMLFCDHICVYCNDIRTSWKTLPAAHYTLTIDFFQLRCTSASQVHEVQFAVENLVTDTLSDLSLRRTPVVLLPGRIEGSLALFHGNAPRIMIQLDLMQTPSVFHINELLTALQGSETRQASQGNTKSSGGMLPELHVTVDLKGCSCSRLLYAEFCSQFAKCCVTACIGRNSANFHTDTWETSVAINGQEALYLSRNSVHYTPEEETIVFDAEKLHVQRALLFWKRSQKLPASASDTSPAEINMPLLVFRIRSLVVGSFGSEIPLPHFTVDLRVGDSLWDSLSHTLRRSYRRSFLLRGGGPSAWTKFHTRVCALAVLLVLIQRFPEAQFLPRLAVRLLHLAEMQCAREQSMQIWNQLFSLHDHYLIAFVWRLLQMRRESRGSLPLRMQMWYLQQLIKISSKLK